MNLLFFTQVYPDEPGTSTFRSSSVCHYWTKEWVKQGHNVLVIYCYPNYHPIFHWIAKRMPMFISQFTNGTLTNQLANKIEYSIDGVEVFKLPMRKIMPKIRYSNRVITSLVDNVIEYISNKGFVPDMILSHFDNPILEIAGKCKDALKIPFSFVLHGYASDIKRLYPSNYKELIEKVDVWGFRSEAIHRDFENNYGTINDYFIAYSGIPDNYVRNLSLSQHKIMGRITYVGALMRRKYPEKVLEGALSLLKNGKMSIDYIGCGALGKTIESISRKENVVNKVRLLGQIPRDKVQQCLAQSDLFIMISRHETFGMVYLEAMANGCITIASKDEGFDGIIKDGVNGFLCKAGDANELHRLIEHIDRLSQNEISAIRKAAIETAQQMTEKLMAEKYLNDVNAILKRK